MNINYIYSIAAILIGVLLLIVYIKDPYPKEEDFGKNISMLITGIAVIICGIILLLQELF